MWMTKQDITQDFAYKAKKMDTLSCTAEIKPKMVKSKDSSHDITENTEQFSLMNKKRGPNFGSYSPQSYNQQPRYGNWNNHGFNPSRKGFPGERMAGF